MDGNNFYVMVIKNDSDTSSSESNLMSLFSFIAIPETAFLYAIKSAGFAYSLAWACSSGTTTDCMCDKANSVNITKADLLKHKVQQQTPDKPIIFEDKKCTKHSLQYGIEESRRLLENKYESDIRWRMDNHNKEAGRLVSFSFITLIPIPLQNSLLKRNTSS